MKVSGTKSYVDIECEGKTARFQGELLIHGFEAIASTMEWLSPKPGDQVSEEDRVRLISMIQKHFRWKRFKVFFVDDKGEKYHRASRR